MLPFGKLIPRGLFSTVKIVGNNEMASLIHPENRMKDVASGEELTTKADRIGVGILPDNTRADREGRIPS